MSIKNVDKYNNYPLYINRYLFNVPIIIDYPLIIC